MEPDRHEKRGATPPGGMTSGKAASRPAFSFCICPDPWLVKEHAAELLERFPADGSTKWERHVFWGDEEPPQRFWEQLVLQGLFGTPRALLLRQAQHVSAAVWKRVSAALSTPNSQSWLILCLEGPWEKGQPKIPAHIAKLRCMAFAEQRGWVWRSPGLDERGLKKHAQTRAGAMGLRFGEGALEAFCAAVPPEAAAVDTELRKLAPAAPDGVVTASLAAAGGYTPDSDVFAFIRHVRAGDMAAAWRELHRGRKDSDALLFPFLALLLREARTLWQLRAGEQVRLHPQEAAAQRECAARLDFPGLARFFDCVLQAERQVKFGLRSPEQALEALTANLILLFRLDLSA